MQAIHTVLTEDQRRKFQPVFAELKPGEAVFHHPLMIHGSYENRTDRPRRAVVINAFLDGTRSDSDESLLEGVPPVPKGERMAGRFFRCCLIRRRSGDLDDWLARARGSGVCGETRLRIEDRDRGLRIEAGGGVRGNGWAGFRGWGPGVSRSRGVRGSKPVSGLSWLVFPARLGCAGKRSFGFSLTSLTLGPQIRPRRYRSAPQGVCGETIWAVFSW